MRSIPLRPILAAVIALLLIFAVRTFACSNSDVEAQTPTVADPVYTDYKSENGQAVLTGLYVDESQSDTQDAMLYVLFDLTAAGSEAATVDSHGGDSVVRFLVIDENDPCNDCTTAETAKAFKKIDYKTALHGYENSLNGSELTSKPTHVVATFKVARSLLEKGSMCYIWLDKCDALTNVSDSVVSYENIILKFPIDFYRLRDNEDAIIKSARR